MTTVSTAGCIELYKDTEHTPALRLQARAELAHSVAAKATTLAASVAVAATVAAAATAGVSVAAAV